LFIQLNGVGLESRKATATFGEVNPAGVDLSDRGAAA